MNALRETRLRDNVVVWTLGGEEIATSYGANCTGIFGREATLLVDPLIAPAHARLVETALARADMAPVRWVVLTHHHTDHALGSSWFARSGATVVAHEECRRGMEAAHPGLIDERRRVPGLAVLFGDAESRAPGLTFADALTIDLGGIEVEVKHPGHGHTPGDAVVRLPAESLVVCGDLVSNGYHVNFEDASLDGFEEGLRQLIAFDAATYVPGHGAPGGREIVDAQLAYRKTVGRLVEEGRAAKSPADRIAASIARAFPGYLLKMVLPETVRRFSESAAPGLIARRPPPTV
ncbi:MAG TPA: MBL fold metallo-hydrolase [Thermoanaerobaculia bacterium]|nr:MBL fold metallo-hydrolase [Thermoanaerobaculia bacterium]